jgi:hypothetical protein
MTEIKRTKRGFVALVRGKYNIGGLPLTVLHRRTTPFKNRAAAVQAAAHTVTALEAVARMPKCSCGHVLTEGHPECGGKAVAL